MEDPPPPAYADVVSESGHTALLDSSLESSRSGVYEAPPTPLAAPAPEAFLAPGSGYASAAPPAPPPPPAPAPQQLVVSPTEGPTADEISEESCLKENGAFFLAFAAILALILLTVGLFSREFERTSSLDLNGTLANGYSCYHRPGDWRLMERQFYLLSNAWGVYSGFNNPMRDCEAYRKQGHKARFTLPDDDEADQDERRDFWLMDNGASENTGATRARRSFSTSERRKHPLGYKSWMCKVNQDTAKQSSYYTTTTSILSVFGIVSLIISLTVLSGDNTSPYHSLGSWLIGAFFPLLALILGALVATFSILVLTQLQKFNLETGPAPTDDGEYYICAGTYKRVYVASNCIIAGLVFYVPGLLYVFWCVLTSAARSLCGSGSSASEADRSASEA
ncbi:uncharacterized protein MONBRDRAFT_35402 [Monosiga brevicollis MX1]|uniref:Uncharacterized protein n=1 Tax=Monosiga brevicollis TaxID=81824 RepID=A9UNT3_MONBE|nr:uncharacterized protein MONBRDRAFT_35402 [Monosiga brevicollis MX1]EDQ92753.1 predicted protein [Monosiga brevicollis MX1]|eukprot:XP_001742515.1 hypothetical protein [Monosiga brevicollis MX1]